LAGIEPTPSPPREQGMSALTTRPWAPIHVVNNDSKRLIEIFVSSLLEISKTSYEINKQKYKGIYRYIENMGENKLDVLQCLKSGLKKSL
jgi:hypothetical protein